MLAKRTRKDFWRKWTKYILPRTGSIATVALLSFVSIATADINVDFGAATRNFEGIGGLSGGGLRRSYLIDILPTKVFYSIFQTKVWRISGV